MDFTTCVLDHIIIEDVPAVRIEDVVVHRPVDATSAKVTLCGAYGKELATAELTDEEVGFLEDDLNDCNFIYTE